jgi:hypothetical protein
MLEFDDEFFYEDVKRPSKAAIRREGRLAIQEELDELGDLYSLPEGIQIPGVKN